MKKIIKEVNNGLVQITIADERWYQRGDKFVPSVTWIAGYYPKGVAFYKWLADKGWDESQAIKQAAGDKGSKVHQAIVDLIDGKSVAMEAKYPNPTTGEIEELTLEEYECLVSFQNWFNEIKPEVKQREIAVFNDKDNYAGTVDLVCVINKQPYIVDFKTSQNIWPEFELQVSAYKHAHSKADKFKLAILQLGYRRNKNAWKWNEVEDKFELFKAAKQIWAEECSKVEPLKKDLPTKLKLWTKVKNSSVGSSEKEKIGHLAKKK